MMTTMSRAGTTYNIVRFAINCKELYRTPGVSMGMNQFVKVYELRDSSQKLSVRRRDESRASESSTLHIVQHILFPTPQSIFALDLRLFGHGQNAETHDVTSILVLPHHLRLREYCV
jgi:hypothetical protein